MSALERAGIQAGSELHLHPAGGGENWMQPAPVFHTVALCGRRQRSIWLLDVAYVYVYVVQTVS